MRGRRARPQCSRGDCVGTYCEQGHEATSSASGRRGRGPGGGDWSRDNVGLGPCEGPQEGNEIQEESGRAVRRGRSTNGRGCAPRLVSRRIRFLRGVPEGIDYFVASSSGATDDSARIAWAAGKTQSGLRAV